MTGNPALVVDRHRLMNWVVIAAAAASLLASPAMAHVVLDAPNGGEVLEPGTVFTIFWHDSIYHGPANYDLWYSTTGPNGPWIVIVADITPGDQQPDYRYSWTVPDTPSDQVRVMVRQDNSGTDYTDISDEDLTIAGEMPGGEEVVLEASRDATLYEGDGTLANGSGSYLFAGGAGSQSNGLERRALIAFDLRGAIPPGATILTATLELSMSRTGSGPEMVELRRIDESWTEGPSDPPGEEGGGAPAEGGDATWVHRSYPSEQWVAVGGSFDAMASASLEIGDIGSYAFGSTPEMVADVQGWLDDPAGNHGWALVMPSPTEGSAKRFDSRDNDVVSSRPRLTVSYVGGDPLAASRILIPAAAHVAGAGGSFFVTTVDVHNAGGSTATLRFEWLPRNTDNSVPLQSDDYTLAPGETRRFPDFLADVFGLSDAVGAAAVLSDADGIMAMSRTFNQTIDGTFGQSLPGVSEQALIPAGTRALLLFLTENGDFRSNLGLASGVASPITVSWELFASDGSSLATGSTELPPFGNTQLNRVLGSFAPIEAAYAHVWTTTAGGAFTCYGSVLDELTSDPTTVPPQ